MPPPHSILRRTDAWIAVAKPAGIAAIPEAAGDTDCLQARIAVELGTRVWVVHRLDKEVSGVILFALNAEEHRRLNLAFEHRLVTKTYLAGAHGVVSGDAGEIDLPLREFGSGRIGVDHEKGRPCLTRWRVRERRDDQTLLEMEPHTERPASPAPRTRLRDRPPADRRLALWRQGLAGEIPPIAPARVEN